MTFIQSLALVISLCVAVPAGMYIVFLFPLISFTVFVIFLLTLFVYLSSQETNS